MLAMAPALAPSASTANPLAALLRHARKEKRLTLRAAAEDLPGISATTLCRVEKGERVLAAGPALLALADRLGLDRDEVLTAAGGLTAGGLQELASPQYRSSLAQGHLRPEALRALRRVHLAQLARASSGTTLEALADGLDLDVRPTSEPPGFDSAGCYRVPQAGSVDQRRGWLAHAAAHLILERAGDHALSCQPGVHSPAEEEATILARYLLLPPARLRDAHRALALPEPRTAADISEMCQSLATEFKAPVAWVAARLAEDGLLGAAA
jgi:transcriptional regulator with XRE-family HTH domain